MSIDVTHMCLRDKMWLMVTLVLYSQTLCTLGEELHPRISPSQIHILHDRISEWMKCREIPGLVLSVVLGNRTIIARGYGMADLEAGVPTQDDTLFCVASLTKAFTSMLLGLLLPRHG